MSPYFTTETPSGWSLLSDAKVPDATDLNNTAAVSSELKVAALVELGAFLLQSSYEWICPSRETEALVNSRFANRYAHNLTDLFGWNRVGSLDTVARLVPATLLEELAAVGILQILDGESVRSRVRFSNVGSTLIAQSAWPFNERDAVLVGPETHQFGSFVERELHKLSTELAATSHGLKLVDQGCDGGVTGVLAARVLENIAHNSTTQVYFLNTNPRVLRFAEVNARIAKLAEFECRQADGLAVLSEPVRLVLANFSGPSSLPHVAQMIDPEVGTGHTLQILDDFLQHSRPGGTLLLCALAPVMRGVDILRTSIEGRVAHRHSSHPAVLHYRVLETDVYGSKLSQPDFVEVERIMRVGITVHLETSGSR